MVKWTAGQRSFGGRTLAVGAAAFALASSAAIAVGWRSDAPNARGAPERIGKPAVAHAGPHVGAARLRAMLRRPPVRPVRGVPESCVRSCRAGKRGLRRRIGAAQLRRRVAAPQSSSAASPKLANDPGFAAAVGGTPPDPQIAVSSTHVLVGLVDRVAFYTKSGPLIRRAATR